MQRRLYSVGLILIAMATLGCGGAAKDALKIAPAAGVLKYKGAPVADVSVAFYPAKGPAGSATTNSKGEFQIKTNGQLGAVVGKHKVTASQAQQTGEIAPAGGAEVELLKKSTIPSKYADQNASDLSIDVSAEGNKTLVLDLTD